MHGRRRREEAPQEVLRLHRALHAGALEGLRPEPERGALRGLVRLEGHEGRAVHVGLHGGDGLGRGSEELAELLLSHSLGKVVEDESVPPGLQQRPDEELVLVHAELLRALRGLEQQAEVDVGPEADDAVVIRQHAERDVHLGVHALLDECVFGQVVLREELLQAALDHVKLRRLGFLRADGLLLGPALLATGLPCNFIGLFVLTALSFFALFATGGLRLEGHHLLRTRSGQHLGQGPAHGSPAASLSPLWAHAMPGGSVPARGARRGRSP
mmetsp:Transcript_24863/g.76764  ORF Transcript_24863/g.76764 Transcript_24863/m.76764 type:complete len:271 (-) Transcript_24863:26-838(-)